MGQGSIMRPTSFGSNITFDANLRSYNFDIGSLEADLLLLRISNGAVHDSDGTSKATLLLPRPISCWAQLENPNGIRTDYKTILDEVGEKATLTAVDDNSTNFTATARFKSVEADLPRQALDTVTFLEFKMNFVLTTEWS